MIINKELQKWCPSSFIDLIYVNLQKGIPFMKKGIAMGSPQKKVTMVLDKKVNKQDIIELQTIINTIAKENGWNGNFYNPLKDKGSCYHITASTKDDFKLDIVGIDGQPWPVDVDNKNWLGRTICTLKKYTQNAGIKVYLNKVQIYKASNIQLGNEFPEIEIPSETESDPF